MIICTNCRAEARDGANFCPRCGRSLSNASASVSITINSTISPPNPVPRKPRPKAAPLPPTPCPSCGHVIDSTRSTKVKCPDCGIGLYVLVDPETKKRRLLDEEGRRKLMARKEDLKIINEGIKTFGHFGISKDGIEREYGRLREGGRSVRYQDAIWSMASRLMPEPIDSVEARGRPLLYHSLALFLESEGKDPAPLLRKARTAELMELKRLGVENTVILCSGGCDACMELQMKKYTVDEALRTHPLPNPRCSDRSGEDNYPFCRCMYLPAP